MKPILILLITFALAFAASALLEIPFVERSFTRVCLVDVLIVLIVAIGLRVLVYSVKPIKKPE